MRQTYGPAGGPCPSCHDPRERAHSEGEALRRAAAIVAGARPAQGMTARQCGACRAWLLTAAPIDLADAVMADRDAARRQAP